MSTTIRAMPDSHDTDAFAAVPEAAIARVGIWEAMRRHWVRTLLPVLVLVPIAAGIGIARSPRYTAESRLIVGRLAVSNPGLSGFVTATQSLAASYSRAVTAAAVTGPVASRLHMTVQQVGSRVSASPIQQSPVFRVIATGTSVAGAIALANQASNALVGYASKLNRENPDGPLLLSRYEDLSQAVGRASVKLHAAAKAYRRSPTRSNAAAVDLAQGARAGALLQLSTVGGLFTSSEAGQSSASLVESLNKATSASSDRKSVLELLIFLAVVVGLAFGAALATAAANRVRRDGVASAPA
jgi:capsular polysaccharide biosynthesis protein